MRFMASCSASRRKSSLHCARKRSSKSAPSPPVWGDPLRPQRAEREFREGQSDEHKYGPALGMATPLAPTPRWQSAESYPDPAIHTLDPRFDDIKPPFNAAVERLATGFRWAEGPVWFGDGRYLLWSDIPNNRIMRWDEETGAANVYRKPSNNANGNPRDRQGRLVTCEHEGRRVTRTEYDGSITVLLDRFEGKRLNLPNDVAVKSDDSIWFSDPPFGILSNYQGTASSIELPSI